MRAMVRVLTLVFVSLLATSAAGETAYLHIRFSHHAVERLKERHIARAWVEHVVRAPDWTEPDRRNPSVHLAFGHIGEAHGMILRVVYTEAGETELVITEYFDREASRRAPNP